MRANDIIVIPGTFWRRRLQAQKLYIEAIKKGVFKHNICEQSVLFEYDHDFLRQQMSTKPHFASMNATAVGNLAFIALYSLNPDCRHWALNILTQYRIWARR